MPIALGEVSSQLATLVRQYPFPKASEANCYDLFGVALSKEVDQYRNNGQEPPYVPREVDETLILTLEQNSFVLVTGHSKAGKSRTACEAVRKIAPLAPVVVPSKAENLELIIERLNDLPEFSSGSVLWLDDLERYLKAGTMNSHVLEIAMGQLGLRIVATIRSEELSNLRDLDDQLGREVQRILERAEEVLLEDRMKPEERERASELYPQLNIGLSLGESFIAGLALKRRYCNGSSSLRAVVRAANDWRRTGLTTTITKHDLFILFKRHCETIEPTQDADEEMFKNGLAEACKPVAHYSTLLERVRSEAREVTYAVGDYISEFIEQSADAVAEEAWQLALERAGSDSGYLAVGISGILKKRLDVAEQALRHGSSDLCAMYLGIVLIILRRWEEAVAALREAITLNPRNDDAHFHLGGALQKLEGWEESLSPLREAISLNPENTDAHYRLSVALMGLKRYDESLVPLRKVIQWKPGYALAHHFLGDALLQLDRPDEALLSAREAIRLEPENARIQYGLGLVLCALKRWEEALVPLRKAIELEPENPEHVTTYYYLGVALGTLKRWEETILPLREAIRRNPENADAHFRLGVAAWELAHWEEAIAPLREAIRLNPGNADARVRLRFAQLSL